MKKVRSDLTGMVFGQLVAIEYSHNTPNNAAVWLCKCSCGVEKTISARSLVSGGTISCGCHGKSIIGKSTFVHGHAKRKGTTSEYRCWKNMKNRCYRESDPHYYLYGGRGITICESWLDSFENFIADMGRRPSEKHSIDRIDVDKNYDPSNCRWGTLDQQSRNKRNNIWLEANGERMIMSDWAIEFGIAKETLRKQVKKGKSFPLLYDYYKNEYKKATT
jgi:hypothetical protein